MTSATKAMFAVMGLLSMFATEQASACDALDREIIDVKSEKIAGYTENGKFDRDLERAEVLKKRIAACSEVNSALAKIVLNEQVPIWIDLTEVKLTASTCDEPVPDPGTRKIVSVPSRSEDTIEAVTSGIGSCK